MKSLYFIKVKEKYTEYLKRFDSKIQDNSCLKNNKPYIGVLIKKDNGQKYFAPLSSPKEKHKIFDKLQKENKLPVDVFIIRDSDEKILGIINFNNMIPVIDNAIIYFNIKEDPNYSLLKKEHIYCIKHSEEILKKSKKVYNLVTKYKKESLVKRSCNFKLLEEKAKEIDSIVVTK